MIMKMKMLSVMALLITVVSCVTTTPITLPEKYNLDTELENVNQLSAVRVSNWEQVDNQSLLFTANGSEYYLAVLDRPLESVITNDVIGLVDSGSSIKARFDKFFVKNSSGRHYYVIEKIYKINGREQAKKIKEQLSKN